MLMVLIFLSLNIVACYDWTLSKILKLFRFIRNFGRPTVAEIIALPRQSTVENHSGRERLAA